jgi:hypothetical protein
MKTPLISLEESNLVSIADMAAAAISQERGRGKYAMGIEFALAELVRNEMRHLAQRMASTDKWQSLIRMAAAHVEERIEHVLSERGIRFDLSKYIKAVTEKLRWTAMEICELSGRLARSRADFKIGQVQVETTETHHPYEVHELGLSGFIEGLWARPAEGSRDIDIDHACKALNCTVEGEWFPYEIHIGDFTFVIDDDGSIFVPVEQLPERLRNEARALLLQLAGALYL